MNWIRDYNVIYNGKMYENCVECRVHTGQCTGLRGNKSTHYIRMIEVIYVDEEGYLDVIANRENRFKFVRKPEVIVCED